MTTDTEGWIEGPPPRLSREAVQCEWTGGYRKLVLCPACGHGGVGASRHRSLRTDIKTAYIAGLARIDNPYGKPGNKEGERLQSKCCNADMVTLGETTMHYVCLHCLKAADAK